MGLLVVVLLVALWASILLPGALRARRASSPITTVSEFERTMSTLSLRPVERMPGRTVMVLQHPASVTGGSRRARVLARRRATLKGLTVAVGLTGLLAFVAGTFGMVMFVLSLAASGAYVAILRSEAARLAEARRKTRALVPRHARRRAPARRPAEALRRTGT